MSGMADVHDEIKFLSLVRLNPDWFLPMVDHAWKVFPKEDLGTEWYDDKEVNIGWDAGLVKGNRPYFLECWASCGITMLTYFVSTEGMEDAGTEELLKLLTDAGLFRLLNPEKPGTSVMKFEDGSGRVFFSINVVVGDEEEVYIEGGKIYPFEPLNEYNRRINGEAKADEE